jgi:hypothetical protein
MRPTLEENQFAFFFQHDLCNRQQTKRIEFAPVGQVLEARVGFDLGLLLPPEHSFWRIVGSAPLPGMESLNWNRNLASKNAISGKALNLFLQYKRSDYLFGNNAKYMNHFRGPYWQFKIDRTDNPPYPPQHNLLEELEAATKGSALVRYVAPMCHTFQQLEELHDNDSLLENSIYVSPQNFKPAHKVCAFSGPTNVIVNPDPQSAEVDSWTQLEDRIIAMRDAATDAETLIMQTAEIVSLLGGHRTPDSGLLRGYRSSEPNALWQVYLSTAEWMFRFNLYWFVALVPE